MKNNILSNEWHKCGIGARDKNQQKHHACVKFQGMQVQKKKTTGHHTFISLAID